MITGGIAETRLLGSVSLYGFIYDFNVSLTGDMTVVAQIT